MVHRVCFLQIVLTVVVSSQLPSWHFNALKSPMYLRLLCANSTNSCALQLQYQALPDSCNRLIVSSNLEALSSSCSIVLLLMSNQLRCLGKSSALSTLSRLLEAIKRVTECHPLLFAGARSASSSLCSR
uniref:Putative secreted peptide n=1 Tax=Anopheles braziliensis TaxID=58242 RepID=A0A2M3ZTP7_9DIPT